jgi:hypothetical protein
MSIDAPPHRSAPIGALLLLVVACGFYVAVLVSAATPLGHGEAAMSDAFASLFLTFGLWIALALLLVNAGLMGEMPRWSAILAVFVVPLSGVAAFVAIDMCSRHVQWAIIFPVALPLLIAAYAMWARLPRLRALLPGPATGAAAWGLILALSIAPLILAAYY